ncbi:hypothetical protein D9M72_634060 [compost metagenome]
MSSREGETEIGGEAILAGIEWQTEEGCLGNTGNTERSSGEVRPVYQHKADDFTECKRHDSEIISAQT